MLAENAWIVTFQVLILFILIAVGYLASKLRMLDAAGSRQLTNLLLVIITPSVIIQSFQTPFERSLLRGLAIALVSAVASHLVGALVARLCFRNRPALRGKVLQFAVVFSNCGFMCIPLLDAILGGQGVLIGSIYIAVFNIAQWTYGVRLMSGERSTVNLRRALVNPGTVSFMLAFPLFIFGITLPQLPTVIIGHLSALNSPLAMIVIGSQMAMLKLGSIFTSRDIAYASFLRLLAVPLIVLLGLHLLPLEMDRVLFLACVIPAAAPTAAGTALFATRHDQDAMLATRTIAFSTLFSVLTIPALILLSDLLRGY